jgi:4-amino-4-deoxy-L-arabinose transferase-like glycosyltransferase
MTADATATRTRDRLLLAAAGAAIVAGVALRFASRVDLWLDEALTVNIAQLPLTDLPAALRRDGAPPLFYVLLHAWMQVFGSGDLAARALPALLGAGTVPLAYAAGREIARRTNVDPAAAGVSAALVTAVTPFAVRYSAEARMYSLAMLLVLGGEIAVWRALERPTPARLAPVALVTGALLYTYYWCAFLVAVVFAVLAARAFARDAGPRTAARRVLAAMAVGVLLFTPWVPSLLWQMRHTGTPWGERPRSPIVVVSTLTQFAGGRHLDARALTIVLAALAAAGFAGVSARASRRNPRRDPRRATGGARWECAVGFATLMVGLAAAVVTNGAYQVRYAAVVFPFFTLAAAHGAALAGRRTRTIALVAVGALGLAASFHAVTQPRSQAGEIAAGLRAGARPGDVVAYCPDQIAPATNRVLPASLGLREFTFPGFGPPEFVDWTDYEDRNRAADPDTFATETDARAGDAGVWLVWSPGYRTYDDKCERLVAALAARRGTADTVVASDDTFEHMNLVRFGPQR